MTPANVKAYNKALKNSKLLNPEGPLDLVHVHSITAGEQVFPVSVVLGHLARGSQSALSWTMQVSSAAASIQAVTSESEVVHAGCGAECSEDGIHYHNATYDAILQTWANQIILSWI